MFSALTQELRSRATAPSTADRAIRNKIQDEHVKQLWIFLGSVLAFFTFVRVVRWTYSKFAPLHNTSEVSTKEKVDDEKNATPKPTSSVFQRTLSALATGFRIVFFRWSIPLGPWAIASMSELTFIFIYITANLIWLLVDTRDLATFMYQDRAALMASAQLPLIVALAGKNNVISWLTGIGHEKLNVLHRAAARTLLLLLWIHGLVRVISVLPVQFDLTHDFMRAGVLGLSAFTLASLLSVRPIRNAAFEFFLVTHIVLILIFLVAGYYHAKHFDHGSYIWPALLFWAFDRTLRFGRLVWNNSFWNRRHEGDALVELLSEDTTRLTLRRHNITWSPGQHAYIILPTVSTLPFEAHPFTIASIPENVNEHKERDIVFLIRGRNGFTGRLREHATMKGDHRVPAFLDGPYGCPPNLRLYSTCILVAGGSGISYTLPLLLDIVRANSLGQKSAVRRVVFVWAVRDAAHLKWISKTLMEAIGRAKSSLIVEPRIYVTGKNYPIPEVPALPQNAADRSSVSSTSEKKEEDITDLPTYSSLKLVHGRPSMKKLLHDEIELALGPVSVDVAGPSSLAESIRHALSTDLASPASALKGAQPVTLHVETFGMVKK